MSNRLFVGNLTFQTTEDDLLQAFQDFGPVAEVKVVTDRETGRSRGFAFVEMADADGARKATEGMNGAVFDGRPLRVGEAEERRPSGGGGSRPRSDRGGRW